MEDAVGFSILSVQNFHFRGFHSKPSGQVVTPSATSDFRDAHEREDGWELTTGNMYRLAP